MGPKPVTSRKTSDLHVMVASTCAKRREASLRSRLPEVGDLGDDGHMQGDKRRHHFVPVSYLEPWKNSRGLLTVQHHEGGRLISVFTPKPEAVFFERGLYDMSRLSFPVEPDLLESGLFASGFEAGYVATRRATIDLDAVPSRDQTKWLAECCLTLYFRNPRFHQMASAFYEFVGENDEDVRHVGAATLVLSLKLARQNLETCRFTLFRASGYQRFWTSDAPSWQWQMLDKGSRPTTDLVALESAIAAGLVRTTPWLCPLSPRWALEIRPTPTNRGTVNVEEIGDARVAELNRCIVLVAHRFRVEPPV